MISTWLVCYRNPLYVNSLTLLVDDPHDRNGLGRFVCVIDLQGTDMYLRLNQATMK
jgi:hypothetical protein